MGVSALLGVVAFFGLLMVIGGIAIAAANINQRRPAQPGIFLAVIGLILALIFFAMSTGVVEVGANETGVVFQQIGGDPATNSLWAQPLTPGVHIIVPFINFFFNDTATTEIYTMSKNPNEGQLQG